MLLKVENNDLLLKNTDNKAVLNNNIEALQEFKNRKKFFNSISARIDMLENKIIKLEEELSLLKSSVKN